MAITIDRSVYPYVIQVPKADMLLIQSVPSEIRQLDMDAFRLELRALEDDEAGMPFTRTHYHNTGVTVSGAVLARVVVITSDYVVEFEDGAYRVNVVGANTNIGERAVVNNVSVSTSNSAGLQDLNSLQAASFGGAVAFKPSSSFSGTTFPVGTRSFPVNNAADLKTILEERGLNKVSVMESLTINSGTDFSGLAVTFLGDNPAAVTVTIDPSANVTNCQFTEMNVQGTLDGNNIFRQCSIQDISYVNGFIHQCALFGTVTLGGGQLLLMDCYSGIPGGAAGAYPKINMSGATQASLGVRNFSGGLGIIDGSNALDVASIDMASGRVIFENTITAGQYWIRGVAQVEDSSAGATIYDYTISEDITELRKLIDADEVLTEDLDGNWTLIDPDDGVTVLRTRTVRDKNNAVITLPDGAPARRTGV